MLQAMEKNVKLDEEYIDVRLCVALEMPFADGHVVFCGAFAG